MVYVSNDSSYNGYPSATDYVVANPFHNASHWELSPEDVIQLIRGGFSAANLFFTLVGLGGNEGAVVEDAIGIMKGMVGNDGQAIIIEDYASDPFREFFHDWNFFTEEFNFEGHMRGAIGEDKWDAVDTILRTGYRYVESHVKRDMPGIPFV